MVTLSITTDFKAVQQALAALRPDIAQKATVRGVNRTLDSARVDMQRSIARTFNLKPSKIREKLGVVRASFKGGRFGVEVTLFSRDPSGKRRAINVINFGARQVKQGVSVRIRKDGARKLIKGAFIGNKGRTVFVRAGKKRLPINPKQTIDVPQMFNTQRINKAVVANIRAKFPEVMRREIAFYVDRFNRGGK